MPLCRQSPPFRTKLSNNNYLPINNQTECSEFFPLSLFPFLQHLFYFWLFCCFVHIRLSLSQEKDTILEVSSKWFLNGIFTALTFIYNACMDAVISSTDFEA